MKNPFRRSVLQGPVWGRLSLAAVVAAGLTLGFSSAVDAGQDASVTGLQFNRPFQFQQMAQTFTPLHAGRLYEFAIYAGTQSMYAPVSVGIWSTSAGQPSGAAALASVPMQTQTNVLGPNLAWRTYTLNPAVPVDSSHQYAIVTNAGALSGYVSWGWNGMANYTAGHMWARSRAGNAWASPVSFPGSAFNFKTWVDASTGPQIGVDNAAGASSTEGTAPRMTGTYSDGGSAVTLRADHGTVAPQSGTGGAWTWTGDAYDEDDAPSSITITATDAAGASASATFPLKVTGMKPVASIGTSPNQTAALPTTGLSSPEGGAVTLFGSATAPDATDQAAGFAYSWNVTRNGAAFSSGTGASYSVSTTDEGIYLVTMTAKDDGGMVSNPVSVTVVGTEITPVPTITSISPADPALTIITPQTMLTFAGSFTDPAPEAHSFSWAFGDGTTSTSLTASHAYTTAGTYTVSLTVKDDEGVGGTATATVTVETTQQALASMVRYVQGLTSLNAGQQNSLIVKLNAASDATARGDNRAAHNELNAFVNELNADLKANKISAVAFNALRADAHAIQGALGTYNRFVDWWPLAA